MRIEPALRFLLLAPVLFALQGCLGLFGSSDDDVPPHLRQLPASTQALLALKGMTQDAPIFVRIFKEESELEVWKWKGGRFELFRTYSICAWSGGLGPKVQQGDRQAPEGFYTIGPGQMNPKSLYHLAFNVGFPNAHDRANGYSGSALMIHGNCKSAGCYAMTDAYIEEIYIMAREAFAAGQTHFHVHAYPFRMTANNMARHRDAPWTAFWARLKEGYDAFEETRKPPVVKVCAKQYLVNVRFTGVSQDPAADGPCPVYAKLDQSKVPGFDGVPQTLLASLKNGEKTPPAAPAAPSPPAAEAAASPAKPTVPQPVQVAQVAPLISASPVVLTAPAAGPMLASATPHIAPQLVKPPASFQAGPARPLATKAPLPEPDGYKLAATAPVPPVLAAGAAELPRSIPEIMTRELPEKDVPADALQKPNRSKKGGKLGTGEPQSLPSSQSVDLGAQNTVNGYGFGSQPRQ